MSRRQTSPDGIARSIFFVVVKKFERDELYFKKAFFDHVLNQMENDLEYLVVGKESSLHRSSFHYHALLRTFRNVISFFLFFLFLI